MGECGCVSNDEKYTIPGPGKFFYVITLTGHCEYCGNPPGVSIERIGPCNTLYSAYKRGDFIEGPLLLKQWPDSCGVAIVTGMEKKEFITAVTPHLVGVSSDEMGENGRIDQDGADVIADEMYEDATFKPRLVD